MDMFQMAYNKFHAWQTRRMLRKTWGERNKQNGRLVREGNERERKNEWTTTRWIYRPWSSYQAACDSGERDRQHSHSGLRVVGWRWKQVLLLHQPTDTNKLTHWISITNINSFLSFCFFGGGFGRVFPQWWWRRPWHSLYKGWTDMRQTSNGQSSEGKVERNSGSEQDHV